MSVCTNLNLNTWYNNDALPVCPVLFYFYVVCFFFKDFLTTSKQYFSYLHVQQIIKFRDGSIGQQLLTTTEKVWRFGYR